MLKIEDFQAIFLIASLVGTLAIASPAFAYLLPPRSSERFSELYILGPSRRDEGYPSNVRVNETYGVFLRIGNHMGSSAYYAVYVKLRNQSEPLANATAGTPSPLPVLYEYRVFLVDGEVWETPVNFTLRGFSFQGDGCFVENLVLNGVDMHVGKMASWHSGGEGYYLQLFFELWLYDFKAESFSFHNRFVGIWLNITS